MSKKHFTDKEIEKLTNNLYVKSVSSRVLLIQMNLKGFLLLKTRVESYPDRFLNSTVLTLN